MADNLLKYFPCDFWNHFMLQRYSKRKFRTKNLSKNNILLCAPLLSQFSYNPLNIHLFNIGYMVVNERNRTFVSSLERIANH